MTESSPIPIFSVLYPRHSGGRWRRKGSLDFSQPGRTKLPPHKRSSAETKSSSKSPKDGTAPFLCRPHENLRRTLKNIRIPEWASAAALSLPACPSKKSITPVLRACSLQEPRSPKTLRLKFFQTLYCRNSTIKKVNVFLNTSQSCSSCLQVGIY